jgi:hypothetical protein
MNLNLSSFVGVVAAGLVLAAPAIAESKDRLCYIDHTAHPTNKPLIGCVYVKSELVPLIFATYGIKEEDVGIEEILWPNGEYRRLCNMMKESCINIKVADFYRIIRLYYEFSLNPD